MASWDSGDRWVWGGLTGMDYAVDPSTESASAAFDRYSAHLDDMQLKKGWPPTLVENLKQKASSAQTGASLWSLVTGAPSAADFWAGVAEGEPAVYAASGVEPGSLPKIESHIAFLEAWGSSAQGLKDAVAQYNPVAFGAGATVETAKDIKRLTDPKQSPWPWVALAGGVLALVVVLR
jgi:hypothetical protein